MAVVSFASAKGGVGKTTLSVNVAAEMALNGIPTTIVDCDINRHATQFCSVFCPANPGVPLRIVSDVNKTSIVSRINTAQNLTDLVIVDLPAGTSEMAIKAMMRSNLIVIPAQKTVVDIRDAARTAAQIAEAEELTEKKLRSVIVWSMVKARWETRTERVVSEEFLGMLDDPSRAILKSPLLEYDAFPAGFLYGWVPRQFADRAGQEVTLTGPGGEETTFIVPKSALLAARNVSQIAEGILDRLKMIAQGKDPGRVTLLPDVLEAIKRNPRHEEV